MKTFTYDIALKHPTLSQLGLHLGQNGIVTKEKYWRVPRVEGVAGAQEANPKEIDQSLGLETMRTAEEGPLVV